MSTYLFQVNVTRDCNLRCTHCYISSQVKKASGTMTAEPFLKIVRDVAAFMNVNGRDHAEIHVIGGEPTMLGLPFFDEVLPQAHAILAEASESGKKWTKDLILVSNLMTPDVVAIARHFDRVNTSWEPESRFPKPKLEEKWRNSLRELQSAGIDFGVTTSVTKPVVAMGARAVLERLYDREGIRQIHFGFFIPSGDGLTNKNDMFPAFEETSRFLIDAAEWYFEHRESDQKLFVNPPESVLAAIHTGQSVEDIVCPIIAGSMDIDFDGRAATCLEAGGNIDAKFSGNVLETSVQAVAEDIRFKRDVMKAMRPHPGCDGCPEYGICRSGCGVLAKWWNPDTDPDCPGFKGFLRHMRTRYAGGVRPKYLSYRGTPGC